MGGLVPNTNLWNGRKLTGVRITEIAVWNTILLPSQIQQLAESTKMVEDIDATNIQFYIKGIGSNGALLSSDTSGVAASKIKALSKVNNASVSNPTKMDAVEDVPGIFSTASAASTIKECGMSVSILSGSSETGAACLAANNKVCTPGEQTCAQQVCNTPGNDMSRIWAMCQPAPSNADLQIAANDAVDSTVHGGVGQTVSRVVMIQSLLLVGHCIQQTTLAVILTAFVLILKCVLKVLHRVLKILAEHLETIFKRFTCFANPKLFSMDPPLLAIQVVNPLNAQPTHLDNSVTMLHPHKRYSAQTMLKLSLGLGFIQPRH